MYGRRMKPSAGTLSACAAAALTSLALATPASAAAGGWQRLGRAPGGDSFAVIAGTPYVAYTTARGVRVARFTGRWRKVGFAVRHQRGKFLAEPALARGPKGTPWLTWTEGRGPGEKQVRVARYAKGRWREVVGGKAPISRPHRSQNGTERPFYSSYRPSLAFLGGRPYVAYADYDGTDTSIKVSRLGSNGRHWRLLSSLGVGATDPHLAVAGRRLYLEYRSRVQEAPSFARFDRASSTWKSLPVPQSGDSALFGGMVGFGGRLSTLFAERPDGGVFVSRLGSDGRWSHAGPALATDPGISPESLAMDGGTLYAAYVQPVNGAPRVAISALAGSTWSKLAEPTPAGSTADAAALAGAAGGGVWLLAHETTGGKSTFELELNNAAE